MPPAMVDMQVVVAAIAVLEIYCLRDADFNCYILTCTYCFMIDP